MKLNNSTDEKIRLYDVLYSSSQCHERFTYWTYALIVISVIFWMIRVVTIFFHIIQYWDIKQFYNIALKIDDVSNNKMILQQTKKQQQCKLNFQLHFSRNWKISPGMKFNVESVKCNPNNSFVFIKSS